MPETLVRVGIVLHAHAEPERAAAKIQLGGGEARPAEPVVPAGPAIEPLRLEKRLTVAEAERLSKADHDLCLFGLSEMSVEVAAAIESHRRTLRLPGFTSLDVDVAAALARHAGPVVLPGLQRLDSVDLARKLITHENAFALAAVSATLTDVTPEVVAVLAASPHWSGSLPRLAVLAPEVAAALAAAQKWDGQLPGVTAFERPDSVAAATALAKRQGPLALPNLARISPKTLTALIKKEDVVIPLVETLELIQEPDGSATDDFVIPKEFQERQQRR